jgi:hypothetical protein
MSPRRFPADIITPDELAAYLRVAKSWVYSRRVSDDPPPACLKRPLRFDTTSAGFLAWLGRQGDSATT